MVAHTGFEPVISALRGQCPRPLDECAIYSKNMAASAIFFIIHTALAEVKPI